VGKPYVKPHQHAMAEAAAMEAAVTRPTRRFAPIKEVAQQARQARHRIRERWGNARTSLINEVRGLLGEQRIVLPKGIAPFRHAWLNTLEHEQAKLTELSRNGCRQLHEEGLALEPPLASSNESLEAVWQADPACPRLLTMPGGGPLTATAWVTAVREATHGKHGRPFAAGLGLIPRPHAPGGKPRRLGISKRGDRDLRKLVVHGA
jgi:transposase